MVALTQTVLIDAPIEAVWRVVAGRFDRIGDWATAVPASTASPVPRPVTDAPIPGRVCRTGLAMVAEVTETIVAFDGAARSLTYEATAGMPSFVTLARNRWQVTPEGDRRTRVTLVAELGVRGPAGRLLRWLLLTRVGRTGRYLLDDLKHYVEHGVPSPRKRRQLDRLPARAAGTRPTTRPTT
jgi:Polyketide cyclase / dehydrase and lipid transport